MNARPSGSIAQIRKFGPYLLIELLLPGGTLLALLLWLSQGLGRGGFADVQQSGTAPSAIEHTVAPREPLHVGFESHRRLA